MYVLHHQLNLETFNCRTSYINAFQYSQQISLFVRFIIKRTHQKSSLVNFQNWKAHWASILIYIILINHLTPTYLHTQNTKAKRAQKGYLPSPFKSTSPITIKTGCTFKRGTKTTLSPPVIHTQRRKKGPGFKSTVSKILIILKMKIRESWNSYIKDEIFVIRDKSQSSSVMNSPRQHQSRDYHPH